MEQCKVCGAEIVQEPSKPTYPVGVSVLLVQNGKLLLAKRKDCDGAGLLSTPGGRLEPNESLIQCAMREFQEECGAELLWVKVIDWREYFRFGKHYFMFYALALNYAGEIRNCIPDKSEDWEWHDIREIAPGSCTEPQELLNNILSQYRP